jgi:hypothetical protein
MSGRDSMCQIRKGGGETIGPHHTYQRQTRRNAINKILLGVAVMLGAVGCGLSAQDRRACEMYVEAGGDGYSYSYAVRQAKALTAKMIQEESDTDKQKIIFSGFEDLVNTFAHKHLNARASVSTRLGMSLAEVERVLEKCPDVRYVK